MKIFRKIVIMAVVLILMLNLSGIAYAVAPVRIEIDAGSEGETAGTYAAFYPTYYGATNWESLSAARNYYGTDFQYTYCGGYPYNYYYTFSDGGRMYFGVIME